MSHHEGVSCDSCMKGNFRGRRYKCLICFDYDSCSSCYENGVTSNRHTTDHPMQCILTRSDFELFYGGETIAQDVPQSFTCPFCGRNGLTETSLQEHVASDHADSSSEVICAICASIPGGEANNVTDDFAAHLQLEHRTPRELEEPQTAIRGRRAPHPSRSSLNSSRSSRRSTQMQYSSVGLTALSPGSAAAAAAAAAASGGSLSSSSGASARDMDPIAELLSQLSGVRRAANQSNSSQLQQLQMQLQLERHSSVPGLMRQGFAPAPGSGSSAVSGSERVPIERVIRRHQQQQPSSSSSSASNQHHGMGSNNNAASHVSHHQQHVNHLMAAASVAPADMPYIVLMEQNLNPTLNPMAVNSLSAQAVASVHPIFQPQQQQQSSQSSTQVPQSSQFAGRFLLSRCNETNLSEPELVSSEVGKADKSLFIQELILTTLADSSPALPVTDEPIPDPEPRMPQQQLPPPLKPQPDRHEDERAKEQAADHQPDPQQQQQQPVPALIEEKIEVPAVATEAVQVKVADQQDLENKNPDPSGGESDPLSSANTSDEVIISPSETARDEERGEDGRVASAIRSKVQSHPPPPPIALRSTVHRNVRTAVVREEPGSGGRDKPVFEPHHNSHKRLPGSENRTTGVPADDRPNRFESPDATTTMAAASKKSCMNRRKTSDFKQ